MLASMAEREKNRRKASMRGGIEHKIHRISTLYAVGEIHRWFKGTQNSRNKYIVRGK